MELYRTLDLKSNPMDSSHFRAKFQTNDKLSSNSDWYEWELQAENWLALTLLCDVRYSTIEKLLWELLIYYYVTNVVIEQQ